MSTLLFNEPSGGTISLVGSDTASNYNVNLPDVNGIFSISTSTTGALGLPTGTTAQRPTAPIVGSYRFNTTNSSTEIYNGKIWVTL